MKHNRELLEAIHTRTFEGIDVLKEVKGNSYAILEMLVELDLLSDLYYKHMETELDLYVLLYDHLATFYVNHQNILNDHPNFTFVDNAYHVDFSINIAHIEDILKEDLSSND
jgi:hypothetical protein